MKVHRPIVQSIVTALYEIFGENRFADKVIEYHLKKDRKWGSRDRKFFAEHVYDIVRNWRKLWNQAGFADADYLNPEAINDEKLLRVWATYFLDQGMTLPSWVEVDDLDVEYVRRPLKLTDAQKNSWTDEMFEYAKAEGEWEGKKVSFKNLNEVAPVFLRTNLLRTSVDELVKSLATDGIDVEVSDVKLGTVKLKARQNVFKSQAFKNGLFEVQDISSQLVGPFLDPQPGERVVDACAGAGGKTLHIATLMQNKGKIIALDIHQWKLDELQKRAARNRLDIVEPRVIDGTKTIKRLEEGADRVLLDVPCSGSGVLRRNPDSKWKMSKDKVEALMLEQESILKNYSRMVKPGGVLVYSTCSFFVSENEKQITNFLKNASQEWKLEEQVRIFPGENDGDGFFMARLRRQKS